MQTNLFAMSAVSLPGWRREEWAYSPLFICGKFPDWGPRVPRNFFEVCERLRTG